MSFKKTTHVLNTEELTSLHAVMISIGYPKINFPSQNYVTRLVYIWYRKENPDTGLLPDITGCYYNEVMDTLVFTIVEIVMEDPGMVDKAGHDLHPGSFLHNHPVLEQRLIDKGELREDHVIVDRKDWEEYQRKN